MNFTAEWRERIKKFRDSNMQIQLNCCSCSRKFILSDAQRDSFYAAAIDDKVRTCKGMAMDLPFLPADKSSFVSDTMLETEMTVSSILGYVCNDCMKEAENNEERR